jgi:pimeloyl-ACP methyl ester carboxylesterase
MLAPLGTAHQEGSALAVFVLVHPAWFGGWCWKKLVPLLEEQGHIVHTPTLTGLGERSHLAHPGIVMQTHIDDVTSVLTYDDLREVILAGTSSSGAVISGVADRARERISIWSTWMLSSPTTGRPCSTSSRRSGGLRWRR